MDGEAASGLARSAYHAAVCLQMAATANEVLYIADDLVIVRYVSPEPYDWPRDIALRADVFVETGDAVGVVRRVRHIIGDTADHVLHLPQDVSLTAFETLGYAWCWSSDLMSKELLMPVQEIKCASRVTVSTSPLPVAVGKAGSDTRTAMQRLEAHEDGAYRGHVHLVATRFATASLAQLVVEPPHRGRGIGGLLLRAAEGQARASGSVRMVLHPSAAAREINFYGRNGYALAGQVRLLMSGSSTPTGSRSRLARSE